MSLLNCFLFSACMKLAHPAAVCVCAQLIQYFRFFFFAPRTRSTLNHAWQVHDRTHRHLARFCVPPWSLHHQFSHDRHVRHCLLREFDAIVRALQVDAVLSAFERRLKVPLEKEGEAVDQRLQILCTLPTRRGGQK